MIAKQFNLRAFMLVVVAGSWLSGILLSSWISMPSLPLLIGALMTLLCSVLLWQDFQARLAMVLLFSLLLGAWHYASVSPVGDTQAISAYIGAHVGTVEVHGDVASQPKQRGHSRVLQIAVSSISTNGGVSWQDSHGLLEVETLGTLIETPYDPNYGDSVELQGKLQPPTPYSPPGTFASMAFPRTNVLSAGGNPLMAALYHLRIMLANILQHSLPQPEAAVLIAIFLGLRTSALQPLIQSFNVTGTAHLIVPSGLKVTILAGIIAYNTRWLSTIQGRLGESSRFVQHWRRWLTTSLVVGCIAVYTVLSGGGSAALRAGIMGILVVIAPRIGRTYNRYTALAAAALLMSIADPFVLWDVGFQISFLGTLGVVLLTPLFQRLLYPLARFPLGIHISELLAVTLAAQIATFPILALSFNQISFIAPLANMLTVPLLSILTILGLLTCIAGFVFAPLGILFGWIIWPLLWYIITIISWCAAFPGAYLSVSNVNSMLIWCYYGLLTLFLSIILHRWPIPKQPQKADPLPPFFTQRSWHIIQGSAVLMILLTTGVAALAARSNSHFTLTFFSTPSHGSAILLHTPNSQTALISEGMNALSLSQQIDSHLPFWQRSLDGVVLPTTKADHLSGLQDIVSRYQVGMVLDAGMLHPSTSYALWQRTISERHLHYTQVRQGTTITMGTQLSLQVLWPPSPLHKAQASQENLDNAVIMRFITPGVRILFLNAAALSTYALTGLTTTIAPDNLQADIVQVSSEAGKPLPTELTTLLREIHPSLLVATPTTPTTRKTKQQKANATGNTVLLPPSFPTGSARQVIQLSGGLLQVDSDGHGWSSKAQIA